MYNQNLKLDIWGREAPVEALGANTFLNEGKDQCIYEKYNYIMKKMHGKSDNFIDYCSITGYTVTSVQNKFTNF